MIKTKTMKNLLIVILALSLFSSLAFVQVANAVTLVPFGGRLLYYSPPIVTAYVNCPSMAAVFSTGGPIKGLIYITVPPGQPKLFYNFYTPGVAVLGNYAPFPVIINCPLQPIFPGAIFGTSVR